MLLESLWHHRWVLEQLPGACPWDLQRYRICDGAEIENKQQWLSRPDDDRIQRCIWLGRGVGRKSEHCRIALFSRQGNLTNSIQVSSHWCSGQYGTVCRNSSEERQVVSSHPLIRVTVARH